MPRTLKPKFTKTPLACPVPRPTKSRLEGGYLFEVPKEERIRRGTKVCVRCGSEVKEAVFRKYMWEKQKGRPYRKELRDLGYGPESMPEVSSVMQVLIVLTK
ncbi:hypothetical protein C0995_004203 [Termitomyces sp. Mi166|nr:hypothetical protein C0995_004203 [Termitomyces sp. Mi166\